MKTIKPIFVVVLLALFVFILNSLLGIPVSRAARQLVPSDYTAWACLWLPTVVAIALVSVTSGLLFGVSSKLMAAAALTYIVYDWISLVFFPPWSAFVGGPYLEKVLFVTIARLIMLAIGVPLAFWLAKLGDRIRRKVRSRRSPCSSSTHV